VDIDMALQKSLIEKVLFKGENFYNNKQKNQYKYLLVKDVSKEKKYD
jgi:hypothetical protein